MGKKYLAYGSNLNLAQMERRCPGSKIIGTGVLKDYRLAFHGSPGNAHATVIPCKGRTVPVLIWEVNADDERRLDRYEGYPHYYFKRTLEAVMDDTKRTVKAMAYIMDTNMDVNYPSYAYIGTIAQGYEDCSFDVEILREYLLENIEQVREREITRLRKEA